MNWLEVEKGLALLGGCRRDVAQRLPHGLGRSAFYGLSNLLASLAAAVSAAHVWGALLPGTAAAAGALAGGVLSGLAVLALNRVLFLSPSAVSGWPEKLTQAAPRVLLGVAVAWWVSGPLTLLLCEDAVLRELDPARRAVSNREDGSATAAKLPTEIQQRMRSLQPMVERLRASGPGEPAEARLRAAMVELQHAQRELAQTTASVEPSLQRNVTLLNRLLAMRGADDGVVATVQEQVAEQRRLLEQAQAKARHAQDRFDETAREVLQGNEQLLRQIGAELAGVEQLVAVLANRQSAGLASGRGVPAEPIKPSLMNRWRALQQILAQSDHPDRPAARRVEIWVLLLLLLFQLAPLILNLLFPPDAVARANEAFDFREGEEVVIDINAQVAQWRRSAAASFPAQARQGPSQPDATSVDQRLEAEDGRGAQSGKHQSCFG